MNTLEHAIIRGNVQQIEIIMHRERVTGHHIKTAKIMKQLCMSHYGHDSMYDEIIEILQNRRKEQPKKLPLVTRWLGIDVDLSVF